MLNRNRRFACVLCCCFFFCFHPAYTQTSGYRIAATFHIASDGWWDYLTADPGSNKLYVSHGTQVNILDKETGDSLGVIANTDGVHGIAIVRQLNKGFISDGRSNSVTVFNLKTNAVETQISTGENPDAIFFDDFSRKVITCNGKSKDLSVIDPVSGRVTATIPVPGKPETAVSDGKGKTYVNIEDKNEIAVVDILKGKVLGEWSLGPGEEPTGLSIDRENHRLFAGCGNKWLVIVDATDGHIVEKVGIGSGCDGTAFDPALKWIFASCGEGLLSVIREESPDRFKLLENVPTKRGARTIGLDPATHVIYLPTADFENSANQGQRPQPKPGTFQVLVMRRS